MIKIILINEDGEELSAEWQEFAGRALARVNVEPSGGGDCVLPELDEVVVVWASDEKMASLHEQFSGVPGPTDVLTFHHGEIVVGVETAQCYAREHALPETEEIARCIVHGLLHLHGYEDDKPASRDAMHAIQEKILSQIGHP